MAGQPTGTEIDVYDGINSYLQATSGNSNINKHDQGRFIQTSPHHAFMLYDGNFNSLATHLGTYEYHASFLSMTDLEVSLYGERKAVGYSFTSPYPLTVSDLHMVSGAPTSWVGVPTDLPFGCANKGAGAKGKRVGYVDAPAEETYSVVLKTEHLLVLSLGSILTLYSMMRASANPLILDFMSL